MASKCKELTHKFTCDGLIGTKEPGVQSRDGIAHRRSRFSPCISITACLADGQYTDNIKIYSLITLDIDDGFLRIILTL